MIKSVTVMNYLNEVVKITLNDPEPEHGLIIASIDGLGPAKASINTTDIATNDGSIYNSARLEERNIRMSLLFAPPVGRSIEDIRQLTYKYFPEKKQLGLIIETDNRTLTTTGYVESNDPNIFSSREGSNISVICPDPYFYSGDGDTITMFSGIVNLFHFPFANESLTENTLVMGQIVLLQANTVYYSGDADIGITIQIHAIGPAHNVVIYDLKTNEQMFIDSDKLTALTGSDIVYGDTITICTVQGNKHITLTRQGVETNILNCVDRQASWFKLHKGDNDFAYRAATGAENLQFIITNKVIYEGV